MIHIESEFKMLLLDRIYKACIRQLLVFTYSCIYVCKYPRTHTHAAWIHAYQCHWVDTIPNTVLSIQNQHFEHVNAAGQCSVKLNMLLMLGLGGYASGFSSLLWVNTHANSVCCSCGSMPIYILFVFVTFRYVSRFSFML